MKHNCRGDWLRQRAQDQRNDLQWPLPLLFYKTEPTRGGLLCFFCGEKERGRHSPPSSACCHSAASGSGAEAPAPASAGSVSTYWYAQPFQFECCWYDFIVAHSFWQSHTSKRLVGIRSRHQPQDTLHIFLYRTRLNRPAREFYSCGEDNRQHNSSIDE